MICLRKQIQLAIGCVKETGKAVTHMPAILFVPVIQAIGFIIFMIAFLTYGIYLASQGKITVLELPVSLSGLEITVRYETLARIFFMQRIPVHLSASDILMLACSVRSVNTALITTSTMPYGIYCFASFGLPTSSLPMGTW
jgi:hypothetical protein